MFAIEFIKIVIVNKIGLWKVKLKNIPLKADKKETIEYKNLKDMKSDNHAKTKVDKQLTKGL